MIREHVGKEQSETNDLCLYMGVYAYICGTIYTRILQKKKGCRKFCCNSAFIIRGKRRYAWIVNTSAGILHGISSNIFWSTHTCSLLTELKYLSTGFHIKQKSSGFHSSLFEMLLRRHRQNALMARCWPQHSRSPSPHSHARDIENVGASVCLAETLRILGLSKWLASNCQSSAWQLTYWSHFLSPYESTAFSYHAFTRFYIHW